MVLSAAVHALFTALWFRGYGSEFRVQGLEQRAVQPLTLLGMAAGPFCVCKISGTAQYQSGKQLPFAHVADAGQELLLVS